MSSVEIPTGERTLAAELEIPAQARGLVVLVHGSGVDRHDRRERLVAQTLCEAGFVALQPELLATAQALESQDAFAVDMQGARLLDALRWAGEAPWAKDLPLGVLGGGIGSAVALLAAARLPQRVNAVVCRGGRPDMALFWAPSVRAPTLFLVDEDGWPYREVYERLPVSKQLIVVPTASRRFEEPTAIERVAEEARRWFSRYLVPR